MISKHLAQAIVHDHNAANASSTANAFDHLLKAKAEILNALQEVTKTLDLLQVELKKED